MKRLILVDLRKFLKLHIFRILILISFLLSAGCQDTKEVPQAVPEDLEVAVNQPVAETETDPTPTPTPTQTASPTPTQTPVPTPTITPTPTPIPAFLLGPEIPDHAITAIGLGQLATAILSPDGKFFSVASSVGVYTYETASLKQSWLNTSLNDVTSLAYSNDGKSLAAGSGEGTIMIFNASDGETVSTFYVHEAGVWALAFSPDDTWLAAGDVNQTIIFWDLEQPDESVVNKAPIVDIAAIEFSPDGSRLFISGGEDDPKVPTKAYAFEINDGDIGQPSVIFTGHQKYINDLALSPDGTILATGSDDYSIIIWNSETGEKLHQLRGPEEWASSVVFTPDGSMLISGTSDGKVLFWDTETFELIEEVRPHTNMIWRSLTLSPDGSIMLSSDRDGGLITWDMNSRTPSREVAGFGNSVLDLEFSKDGQTLFSQSGYHHLVRWDMNQPGIPQLDIFSEERFDNFACSPDDTMIAAASSLPGLMIWDTASGEQNLALNGHSDDARKIAFSPDGRHIATGSVDKTINIWDLETEEFMTLRGHDEWISALDISPDGRMLASGSADKTIILWDMETGEKLAVLTAHDWGVWGVAFSPDGRWLASASGDRSAIIWDLETLEPAHVLTEAQAGLIRVAFSPDSSMLASTTRDSNIQVWHVASGTFLGQYEGHVNHVYSLAFAPGGDYLASGSLDGRIIFWDAVTPADLWWTTEMQQNAAGEWIAPDEVIEKIKADYDTNIAERREVFFSGETPDIDQYAARVAEWYTGHMLEFYVENYIPDVYEGKYDLSAVDWETCTLEVTDFSPDGLEANVSRSCSNGMSHSYNVPEDRMDIEERPELGLVVHRLRYDAVDDRWKTMEFVRRVAPEDMPKETEGETDDSVLGTGTIEMGAPQNASEFTPLFMIPMNMETPESVEDLKDILTLDRTDTCPAVWIKPKENEHLPTFTIYIEAPGVERFLAILHTADITEARYAVVTIGTMQLSESPLASFTLQYMPVQGGGVPRSFVIEILTGGCEPLSIPVSW